MYDNLNNVTRGFEDKANQIDGHDAWIFKAKKKERVSGLLSKVDSTIGKMPTPEEQKLKQRFDDIIPNNATHYIREYDDQFLEALVEILGWSWLKDKYPLSFPQFTQKTPDLPDLIVKNTSNRVIAAMECKKIRSSDEDRSYYEEDQGTVKQVKNKLTSYDHDENPFLRKLRDTLSKAEGQVNQANSDDKFIFLDLTFDTPLNFQCLKEPIICGILHLANELNKKRISLVAFERFQVDKPITTAGLS